MPLTCYSHYIIYLMEVLAKSSLIPTGKEDWKFNVVNVEGKHVRFDWTSLDNHKLTDSTVLQYICLVGSPTLFNRA